MTMGPELLIVIVGQVATAAGVYAAIRADLARAIERATHAQAAADKAHQRIDNMMERQNA